MAFCDAMLWSQLVQAATAALKAENKHMGEEDERKAATGLVEADGLGETWKSIALSASWSFWKDLTKPHNKVGMKTQDFAKHLQETGHFKTIAALDDIWQARTKNLRMFSNLRIFRDPIKPLWEVPQNRDGGKFVLILNKTEQGPENGSSKPVESPSKSTSQTHEADSDDEDGTSQAQSSKSGAGTGEKPSAEVPLEYKLCLALMVLGLLGPVDQFCGCVLSIRAFGHMISIWVSSSSNDSLINHIKANISTFVGIPLESISFQRHNESIRNNTRNLSKTETRKRMREARAKGDLIETPPGGVASTASTSATATSKPTAPRRKSESEKPVWGSSLPDAVKGASHTPSHDAKLPAHPAASSTTNASGTTTTTATTSQHPSGIGRSVSGGKLQISTGLVMPSHGTTQPYTHPNHPAHGQQQQQHSGQQQQGQHSPRGFVSPRSGQAHPPTSPRGGASSVTSQSTPSTPADQGTTARHEAPYSEPGKGSKATGAKRAAAVSREKVHFQENVSVHAISRGQAVQTRPGPIGSGRPAAIAIPDIHILTGTPPPSASPISFLNMTSTPVDTDDNDDDDGSWIPAGSSKPHHKASTSGHYTNGQSQQQPIGGRRTTSTSSEGAVAAAASGFASNQATTTTTTTTTTGDFGTKKRRTQSVGATGQKKPDPNYVSPEALFGADLPLLSPSGTPHPSVPPSPPAELDEDDFAYLASEKSKQQHDVAQAVADKLSMGPLSPRMPPPTHSSPRSSASSTQDESLSTSSSGSPAHAAHHHPQQPNNDASSRRRSRQNKRRKSTTDSANTTDYNGDSSSPPNQHRHPQTAPTINESRPNQIGARSASTSSQAPPAFSVYQR